MSNPQETKIDWHAWFDKNARGGLFKYMLDVWTYNSPFLEVFYALLPPPRKVLDIGTGFGGTMIPLACMGYEVTATDLEATMLDTAKRTVNYSAPPC